MGRIRVEHVVPAVALVVLLLVVADLPAGADDGVPGLGGLGAPLGPGAEAGSPVVRWLAFGLLVAPAVMVYAHRGAAAAAAVVCAAGWAVLGLGYGWRDLLPCAYALVAILVARHQPHAPVEVLDRRPVGGALTAAVSRHGDGFAPPAGSSSAGAHRVETVHRETPRWPGGPFPAVARGATVAGVILLGTGVAALGVAGGRMPWAAAAAVIAFGLGVALLLRARAWRQALRDLFGRPRPVRAARVVDQLGYLHVLVPAADGRTALEFGIDTADTWTSVDPEDADPRTRPARLFGDPWPGDWVAVEVDGVVHVPVEPVGVTTLVPYDPEHGLPREISDDEEQLADPDALTDADRRAAPGTVREHRVEPVRAWCTTVLIGLGAALGAAELTHLAGWDGTWTAALAVAAAGAAGYETGWRTQVRPRLRWHLGGVASVGFGMTVREPWTVDTAAVHDDEGAVTLAVGDSVLTVPAPAPWPAWTTRPGWRQRSGEQLVAALRSARTQAFAIASPPPPPLVETPRRPVPLLLAWAATVVGTLLVFSG